MLQPDRLKKMMGSEPAPETVKPEERQFWNGFVDFLDKRGLKGSEELDKKDVQLSKKLFEQYAGEDSPYSYEDFVPKVQASIKVYRDTAIDGIKNGTVKLDGYKGEKDYDFDSSFMQGLSDVDGFAGSKTTSWKFPNENVVDPKTNEAVRKNTLYAELDASKYKKMKP